jgi:hypothetical protein
LNHELKNKNQETSLSYPIAAFTQVEGDKIRSEHTYFDRRTVAEKLGFRAKQT